MPRMNEQRKSNIIEKPVVAAILVAVAMATTMNTIANRERKKSYIDKLLERRKKNEAKCG